MEDLRGYQFCEPGVRTLRGGGVAGYAGGAGGAGAAGGIGGWGLVTTNNFLVCTS